MTAKKTNKKSFNTSTSGTSTKTVVLIVAGVLAVIVVAIVALQFFRAQSGEETGTSNTTQVQNPGPSSYNTGESSSAPEATSDTGKTSGERPTKPKGNAE